MLHQKSISPSGYFHYKTFLFVQRKSSYLNKRGACCKVQIVLHLRQNIKKFTFINVYLIYTVAPLLHFVDATFWIKVNKGLSAEMLQGSPSTPPLLQTRLCINWASEAAFGLILYVSGPWLRRGYRQCNKCVCQLTAIGWFPPRWLLSSQHPAHSLQSTPQTRDLNL